MIFPFYKEKNPSLVPQFLHKKKWARSIHAPPPLPPFWQISWPYSNRDRGDRSCQPHYYYYRIFKPSYGPFQEKGLKRKTWLGCLFLWLCILAWKLSNNHRPVVSLGRGVAREGRGEPEPPPPLIWQISEPCSNHGCRLCPSHYCQPPRFIKLSTPQAVTSKHQPQRLLLRFTTAHPTPIYSIEAIAARLRGCCLQIAEWCAE